MSRTCRACLFQLGFVLLAWGTPLRAQAPARALPLPSNPAPSFRDAPPEYRLNADAHTWPRDPAVGGMLGGAIGCASGVVLAFVFSSRDRRTNNAGAGCLLLGAVGMGAGSGWRVPGEDYFRPR
jgi:hypothetical protein